MEARATLRYGRVAPRKARYVADMVRGLPVGDALSTLKYSKRGAARMLEKLLKSAIANAEQTGGVNVDELFVRELTVDEGPTWRRWRPRAHGRATRIRKRTSHIRIVLDNEER